MWRDMITAALTAVAVLGAATFGWWFIELIIIIETPPGRLEWGFMVCPTWLGWGGLAMAVIAMIIREKFFPPRY